MIERIYYRAVKALVAGFVLVGGLTFAYYFLAGCVLVFSKLPDVAQVIVVGFVFIMGVGWWITRGDES